MNPKGCNVVGLRYVKGESVSSKKKTRLAMLRLLTVSSIMTRKYLPYTIPVIGQCGEAPGSASARNSVANSIAMSVRSSRSPTSIKRTSTSRGNISSEGCMISETSFAHMSTSLCFERAAPLRSEVTRCAWCLDCCWLRSLCES